MSLQWQHIESLPEFQQADPVKQRKVRDIYFRAYDARDSEIPDEEKHARERQFVYEGMPTLSDDKTEKSLLEKAMSLFGIDTRQGPTEEQKARALMSVQAKDEGIPLHEYRQKSGIPDQLSGRFGDAVYLGIPGAIEKTLYGESTVPQPSGSAEKIAGGIGELAGFVAGGGGLAAGAAGKAVASRLPQAATMLGKVGTAAATGAAGLGAGYAARNIGEAIQEKDLPGFLKSEFRALKEGAETGAIFGVAGQIPNRIARIATGMAMLEGQRAMSGNAPWMDNRPIEERAFDIAQDIFFLWRYHGPEKAAEVFERGMEKAKENPEKAGEYVNDIRSEGQKIRENLRNMSPEQRAEYMRKMQEYWAGAEAKAEAQKPPQPPKPEVKPESMPQAKAAVPEKPSVPEESAKPPVLKEEYLRAIQEKQRKDNEFLSRMSSPPEDVPEQRTERPEPEYDFGPAALTDAIRPPRAEEIDDGTDPGSEYSPELAGRLRTKAIPQKKDFQLIGRPYGATEQRPQLPYTGEETQKEPVQQAEAESAKTNQHGFAPEEWNEILREHKEVIERKRPGQETEFSPEVMRNAVKFDSKQTIRHLGSDTGISYSIRAHMPDGTIIYGPETSEPSFPTNHPYYRRDIDPDVRREREKKARAGAKEERDLLLDIMTDLSEEYKKDSQPVSATGKESLPVGELPNNIFALRKIAKERGIDISDIKGTGALARVRERLSAVPAEPVTESHGLETTEPVVQTDPVRDIVEKSGVPKGNVIVARMPETEKPVVKESLTPEKAKGNVVGTNRRGNKIFTDENGNRFYTDGPVRISASVSIIPGGGMEIMSPKELYHQGGRDFLTEAEINEFDTEKGISNESRTETDRQGHSDIPAVPAVDRVHDNRGAGRDRADVSDAGRKKSDTQTRKSKDTDSPADTNRTAEGREPARRSDTGGSDGDHRPVRNERTESGRDGRGTSGEDTPVGVQSGRAGDSGRVKKEVSENDRNHEVSAEDILAPKGDETKIQANIRAIRLLKSLGDRNPTPEEKKTLAQYTGWGAHSQKIFKKEYDHYLKKGKDAKPEDYFTGDDLKNYTKWAEKYGKHLHPNLGGMMNTEEWTRAEASTLNAHYTSKEVISAMWDIAKHLGFRGGVVLEPAAGAGHFLGLMPRDLAAKSQLRAVELDTTTGSLLKKLYPQANVQITGFEKAKGIPDNSLDLVISNFPFGNFPVFDKSHPEYSNWSIHNYFFARSVDAVKPGGMVIAITSHFTLDTVKIGRHREWLANKADLIGAIRLPYTAFQGSAGTEVVTDILILRKKDSANSSIGKDFRYSLPMKLGEHEVYVNEYFHKHPEMVMGKHTTGGSMYSENEYTVEPVKGKIEDQIRSIIEKLPANIAGEGSDLAFVREHEYAGAEEKEAVIQERNGKMVTVEDGKFVEPWIPDAKGNPTYPLRTPAKAERARQYVKIREAAKELIAKMQDDRATDTEIAGLQEKLNEEYDAFTKKYKTVNGSNYNSFLRKLDAEFPIVDALETVRREIVNGEEVIHVEKAPIFTRRTVFPFKEPDKADSPEDAVKLSLVYRSGIDTGYIGKLLGKSPEAVREILLQKELVFENPSTGLLEGSDTYLSGNVKEKLRIAQERAADAPDNRYERNIRELEAVKPADLGIEYIGFRLGSSWIPEGAVEAFLKEEFGVSAKVEHVRTAESSTWKVRAREGTADAKNTTTYGTPERPGHKLVAELLNLKRSEITYTEKDGGSTRTIKDEEATQAARKKQDEIAARFISWAKSHKEWGEKLETVYNETKNGYVLRKFPVPDIERFPHASAVISLKPHQKRAVSRAVQESCLLAYGVGTGKTFTYISAAMEMRRLGTARKPMIVVHNSTVGQYASSFRVLYPGAKVLVPNWQQRTAKMRKKTLAQIATGDWDAVVLPQTFFDMIANDPEREAAYIREQLEEMEEVIAKTAEAEGKDAFTVKDLNKLRERKKAQLESLLYVKNRDEALTFEQLGIDALLIDEAHAYKRSEFYSKMTKVKGIDNSASKRSSGLLLKARYVQGKTNGKNIILATGTPISNTTAEMWTLMRYIRPDLLEEYGVSQFDDFATSFGETVMDLEKNLGGNYVDVERFIKYYNGPELLTMWRTAADVILTKDAGLNLPSVKGGKPEPVVVPQTKPTQDIMKDIMANYNAWSKLPGKEKKEQSHVPLVLYGLAKKASVDPRMVNSSLPDDPESKINQAVRRLHQIWKDTEKDRSTQVVFLDVYQDSSGTFNAYEDIRTKLISKGIPKEEILLISEAANDVKREVMFQKIRTGQARIIIGSTEKLGVGVDMPQKMVAAHHLDVPARPMDMEQRNGRIVRQGNENAEVQIFNYVVENSLDAVGFDRLLKKQRFIDQIMTGDIKDRSFDDPFSEDQASFGDLMAAAAGEEGLLLKERSAMQKKVRDLMNEHRIHQEEQTRISRNIRQLEKDIPKYKAEMEPAEQKREMVMKDFPDGMPEARKDIYEDLEKQVQKSLAPYMKYLGKDKKAVAGIKEDFTYTYDLPGGYRLEIATELSISTYDSKVDKVEAGYTHIYLNKGDMEIFRTASGYPEPGRITAAFNRAVKDALSRPGELERGISKAEKDLAEFQKQAQKEYTKSGEIQEANKRLAEVEEDLRRLKQETETAAETAQEDVREDDYTEPEPEPEEKTEDRREHYREAYAGGSTLYSGIPIPELIKMIKKFKLGLKKKDISVLSEFAAIPHWMARHEKQFKPLYDIVQKRFSMKNQIQNSYLQDLLPVWQKLSKKEKERVGKYLWKGDELGKVLNGAGLSKLTPNEQSAYEATREVLDYIWYEDRIELMREMLDLDAEGIKKARQEMGSLPAYMPHSRKGRYFGRVKSKTGDVKWRQHFDDMLATMSRGYAGWSGPFIRRKLEKQFPGDTVEIGEVFKDFPEEGFFEVSPEVMQEMINRATGKMKTGTKQKEIFKQALEEAVADIFKARGFMSHGMKRSGVPGYDKSNWQDAVLEYVTGWSGFKSKMLASREVMKAWPKIDWREHDSLRAYADKYIKDAFSNDTKIDRISGQARGYLFYQFLGGSVKSAVVNLTQNPIAFIPRLSMESKWAATKTAKEMAMAAKDVIESLYTQPDPGLTRRQTAQAKRLSAEEMRGLKRARENGIISDQWTEELMGQLPGKYGTWTRDLGKIMKFMFGSAEIFNRETAYITAFRAGKEKGMHFEKAAEFAEKLVLDSHFQYGKFNLPPFARGGNPAKMARAMYTFRSYSQNLFHLWSYMAKSGPSGYMALGRSLGALLLLGGISAMPLIKSLEEWIQSLTGRNIRSEITEKAGEWSRYIFYGLPELIGVDLSGSLGQDIPKSVPEVVGVPYEWAKRTGQMTEDLAKGDLYRAVEDFPLMPSALRNPLQAWRYRKHGYESRSGKPVMDDDGEQMNLTTAEAWKKGLGFQPTKVSEKYRKDKARKQGKEYWEEKKDSLLDQWTLAVQREGMDSEKAEKIMDEIRKFNDRVPDFIPPITRQSLKNRVSERTSGREKLLQEAYQ